MDVAKGILILLVVLGHSINVNYGFLTRADNIIYSFHMPAFFVISGYLTYIAFSGNEIIWMTKKAIQRFIPIIFFGILYYLFSYYSYMNNGFVCLPRYANDLGFFSYSYHMLLTGMGEGLWFFWSLIWCGLIIAVSHLISRKFKFGRRNEILTYLYMCAIVCCVKLKSGNSFGVEQIQYALPFFAGGYLISMNIDYIKRFSMQLLVLMSVIFICLCIVNNFSIVDVNLSVWLWNMSFVNSICRIFGAICGTAFIILLSKLFVRIIYLNIFLEYCGKNSLIIYVIHPLLLAMPFIGIGIERVGVGFIVSVIAALSFGYMMNKIWFIRAFVFGEWKDINRVGFLNRFFILTGRKFDMI